MEKKKMFSNRNCLIWSFNFQFKLLPKKKKKNQLKKLTPIIYNHTHAFG